MIVFVLQGELHPDGPLCDFQAFWMSFFGLYIYLSVLVQDFYSRAKFQFFPVCSDRMVSPKVIAVDKLSLLSSRDFI